MKRQKLHPELQQAMVAAGTGPSAECIKSLPIVSQIVYEQDRRINHRTRLLLERGITTRQLVGLEDLDASAQAIVEAVDAELAGTKPIATLPKPIPTPPTAAAALPDNGFSTKGRTRRRPWTGSRPPPNAFGIDDRFVREWPALGRANHCTSLLSPLLTYAVIIQQHHATSKHFDLRLQCGYAHVTGSLCDICGVEHRPDSQGRCPGTISFAVPLGLEGLERGRHRLGVETELHGVPYCTHEGHSVGTTMLFDVGTYSIVTSLRSAKAGKDKAPDSSDEEEDAIDPGLKHERALGHQYRDDSRGQRSFVVLLHGERYTIRLAISNQNKDFKHTMNKLSGRQVKRRSWVICLATNPATDTVEFTDHYAGTYMADRSLISGRTIEEIKREPRLRGGDFDGHEEDGIEVNVPKGSLDKAGMDALLRSLR